MTDKKAALDAIEDLYIKLYVSYEAAESEDAKNWINAKMSGVRDVCKIVEAALTNVPSKCGSVGKEACMSSDQIAEDCKMCNTPSGDDVMEAVEFFSAQPKIFFTDEFTRKGYENHIQNLIRAAQSNMEKK